MALYSAEIVFRDGTGRVVECDEIDTADGCTVFTLDAKPSWYLEVYTATVQTLEVSPVAEDKA